MLSFKGLSLLISAFAVVSAERFNEIKIRDDAIHNNYVNPLPHTYLKAKDIPDNFSWGNVDGKSYLTHSLNQHLPQYCGSCWAHGSISALADRIKIARGSNEDDNGGGDDINLSIQYVLNCGTEVAGSCYGGYHTSTYEFIQEMGYIPYDTCMPYLACSKDSKEGFCKQLDTTCHKNNICRTCDTFAGMGGSCVEIDYFPNATVVEYGLFDMNNQPTMDDHIHAVKSEIYARGPVAATINAEPIVNYRGGIFTSDEYSKQTNHIVSIVGWGNDEETDTKYWIIRNSWGQYWGELGYMKLKLGSNLLGIEGEIAWATPGSYTVHNFPCSEDGKNCNDGNKRAPAVTTQYYQDPSIHSDKNLLLQNRNNKHHRNHDHNRDEISITNTKKLRSQ